MKTCLVLLLLPICAQAALVKPSAGSVEFLATGKPSALKISGKGSAPSGQLNLVRSQKDVIVSGKVAFALDSLATGIEMRDRHMKEKYLEVGKFPQAQLFLKDVHLPPSGEGSFSGELELHGVKKPVQGKASLSSAEAAPQVKAQFSLQLKDYGIEIPSFAGITVSDAVDVNTEFQTQADQ